MTIELGTMRSMEKFFTALGKVILVLGVVSGIAFIGYRTGQKTPAVPTTDQTSSLPSLNASMTETPTLSASPSATPPAKKTVNAGLDSSSGLSFTKYSISVPGDWLANHTTTNEGTWVDTLVITKGSYELKIFQAATGGAICLYPTDTPMEGPSSSYDTFVPLVTADNIQMRRSTTNATSGSGKGFTVCQYSQYGNYQQPTIFGHTSYRTPTTPEESILLEMDAMIASLKKL